jgi:hypothetical protein
MELTSGHFALRPFRESDAPNVARLANNPKNYNDEPDTWDIVY